MAQPPPENARRDNQPAGRGVEAARERPQERARHGSYRAGFSFGIMSFLAVAVFGVVSTIATARIYGVHIIGQFAIVSAPVATLWVVSTAKEQAALIKEITNLEPRHPRVTQLFAAVFTFSCGLTVVMALIVAGVSVLIFRGPLHHPGLVAPMLVSLAGYTIVTNTGWNIDSIFSAFVAGRQLFWVRLHETLSFLTIAVPLGIVWHSVWGLVGATIAASLTALIHRTLAVRRFVYARLNRASYREGMNALPGLLRFGLKITPGGIAQGVSQQVGIWAIALVAPVGIVGAYSRAQTIPERLQQVNLRIGEVLYPTLVGRRGRGDHKGFDRALLDTSRYALIGMLLIASVFGGAAHGILSLFGPGFARAAPAFALLIAFPALATISSAQTQALWSVEQAGYNQRDVNRARDRHYCADGATDAETRHRRSGDRAAGRVPARNRLEDGGAAALPIRPAARDLARPPASRCARGVRVWVRGEPGTRTAGALPRRAAAGAGRGQRRVCGGAVRERRDE